MPCSAASRLGLVCFLLGSWFFSRTARAEDAPRPTLFLSCPAECFDLYLRQELSYFDFTRDRHQAERVVLVVRQPSAGGGERFTVSIFEEDGSNESFTDSFMAPPGAPPEVVRRQLLQSILKLLKDRLADTPHGEAFELSLPARSGLTLSHIDDPWDYWVFAPELMAEGSAGSQYYWMELAAAMTVRRITDEHKLRFKGRYGQTLSRYILENGDDARGSVYSVDGQAIYAYSLGRHFGLGGIGTTRSSQFENLEAHLRGGPLIEYNFFPYAENARQQLRLAYQAGAWANWYFEVNQQGLLHEMRPYHALSLVFDFNQPWGSVQWVVQGNQFIDDPALYRLSSGALLSLNLVEGLAILFEGKASYVQDQITLRARPLTDLELLLGTAQQPTDFLTEFMFGLTYTWGSVHNTIVNPRFGRVDVEEE